MKKIAIVWPGFTGYLGECWRRLAEVADLRVYVEPSVYDQGFEKFVRLETFEKCEKNDGDRVVEAIREFGPEVTIVCGWGTPICRAVGEAKLPGRKVLALDMPWEKPLRKLCAKIVLSSYLKKFDKAFVPGKAARKYAEFLGFNGRVVEGMNPSGWERFATQLEFGVGEGERTGFVFVGRDVPEKGLDVLREAYEMYRGKVDEPWNLDIVGGKNFVEPKEMPRVMSEHACLILPSRWEPWGVVVAEAMSAGLCTIASNVCGIAADIEPTFVFKSGDAEALSEAMVKIHYMSAEERKERGECARKEAERYSAANWVKRVMAL